MGGQNITPAVRDGLRRVCIAIDRAQSTPDIAEFDLMEVAME